MDGPTAPGETDAAGSTEERCNVGSLPISEGWPWLLSMVPRSATGFKPEYSAIYYLLHFSLSPRGACPIITGDPRLPDTAQFVRSSPSRSCTCKPRYAPERDDYSRRRERVMLQKRNDSNV